LIKVKGKEYVVFSDPHSNGDVWYNKNVNESLNENKVNFVVDDIFFNWDEEIDDDREGISQGTTTHKGKRATQMSFDTNDRQGLHNFTKSTVKLLKKSGVKYNWMNSELYIYH
jgi:hypothetical protein